LRRSQPSPKRRGTSPDFLFAFARLESDYGHHQKKRMKSLTLGIAFFSTVLSQSPTFDVASIKPSAPGPAGGPPRVAADAARFVAANATLRSILQFAYRPASGRTIRAADVIGVPDWADRDRFDIEAKLESGAGPVSQEQMRPMVQSLLMDRFQLKTHWETRDMPTYNLIVAKNGARLKLSENQSPVRLDAQPRGTVRTIAKPSPAGIALTMSVNAVPIDMLVATLQSYAGRPLFDKTGLNGLFDAQLEFFLEAGGPAPQPVASDSGPTFAAAIEEQLGLKLESSRGPVEVLVIDSVQRPSQN
jgi:uncharacterized protein (TIGR03435 family)